MVLGMRSDKKYDCDAERKRTYRERKAQADEMRVLHVVGRDSDGRRDASARWREQQQQWMDKERGWRKQERVERQRRIGPPGRTEAEQDAYLGKIEGPPREVPSRHDWDGLKKLLKRPEPREGS